MTNVAAVVVCVTIKFPPYLASSCADDRRQLFCFSTSYVILLLLVIHSIGTFTKHVKHPKLGVT
jgi:hypothetical protein